MLNIGIRAAHAAGDLIARRVDRLHRITAAEKGPNDFVSEVDRDAEQRIIEVLQKFYPDHAILAEESGAQGESDYQWVIDPLDGTTNFLHGFPQFAVSVALKHKGILDQAVVYDPLRQELFTASRGVGAFLNDRRIRVSQRRELAGSLIGTGFPYRALEQLDAYIGVFRKLAGVAAGIRRPGAASLDLAYVACGRLDGFWEYGLQPWDIAAGALLIREAGGYISDMNGDSRRAESGDVVAGNPRLHQLLLDMIRAGADAQAAAGEVAAAEQAGAAAEQEPAAPPEPDAPAEVDTRAERRKRRTIRLRAARRTAGPRTDDRDAKPRTARRDAKPHSTDRTTRRTDKPRTTRRAAKPRTTHRADKPRTASRTTKPRTASRTTKPRTTKPSATRRTAGRTAKPRAARRDAKPRTTGRAAKPRTTRRTDKPRTTDRTAKPRATRRDAKPGATRRTDKPRTTRRTDKPRTTDRTAKPRATRRDAKPGATRRTDKPRTGGRTTKPRSTSRDAKPRKPSHRR